VITSGSNNLPVGALVFEEDGTMNLTLTSDIDEADLETITLMADYFQYALSREDWLLSFIDQILENHSSSESTEKCEISKSSHLRLIMGGKNDTSGSQ
jgi:hypothetical protein